MPLRGSGDTLAILIFVIILWPIQGYYNHLLRTNVFFRVTTEKNDIKKKQPEKILEFYHSRGLECHPRQNVFPVMHL